MACLWRGQNVRPLAHTRASQRASCAAMLTSRAAAHARSVPDAGSFHQHLTNEARAARYAPQQGTYLLHTYDTCPPPAGCDRLCGLADSSGSDCARVDACAVDDDEEDLFDHSLASHTVESLRDAHRLALQTGRPFLVIAGFIRPHAPWKVPARKVRELNDAAAQGPCVAYESDFDDSGAPFIHCSSAGTHSIEVAFRRQYISNASEWSAATFPGGCETTGSGSGCQAMSHCRRCGSPLPAKMRVWARAAYFRALSWVDEQVGRVLHELDALDEAKRTLVVAHSDNGFHLGENGLWTKFTTYELATRVPLIIRAPWKTRSVGRRTPLLVELLDLYPTMAALAGAPQPAGDAEARWPLEGTDVSAIFDDPADVKRFDRHAAFSQYFRCAYNADSAARVQREGLSAESVMLTSCSGDEPLVFMGYAARTLRWRYVAWMRWANGSVDWTAEPAAAELYDLGPPGAPNLWPGSNGSRAARRLQRDQTCPRKYELGNLMVSKPPLYATTFTTSIQRGLHGLLRERFQRL